MKNIIFKKDIHANLSKIILSISLLLISISSYSTILISEYNQSKKFTFEFKNTSTKDILNYIEKNSEYVFLYDQSLDISRKRNIKITSEAIDAVLNNLFQGTTVVYEISDRQIMLKQNKSTPVPLQQKRKVTGNVVDATTKHPIVGASVWIKESTTGVFTDENGKYTILVNGNAGILVYSFIGYKTQEIPIGDKETIDVLLTESEETSLDEVVVIAYGSQKKESVIGAISTIDATKLKAPTSKISNVLAGQLAGVIGMNRSGEPGAGSEFYIRGVSTFNTSSRNPLVLVDGIERSLDLVDPEDIESFSILKDATATAVYGVRGANGVLLINTRKGKEGKPKITVRAEVGILGPTKLPKMVNSGQWVDLYNEAFAYSHDGRPFYTEDVVKKYKDGSDPQLYPNTNWINDMYKDWASNQRVNVNVSGGGSMVKYYVAGSLYNEGSIFEEDKNKTMKYNSSINFSKVNFRANLDINVTRTTLLSVNLATVYEKKNSPGTNQDIWFYSFATSPNAFPMKYDNGYLAGPTSGTGYNPYNLMAYSGYKEEYWNNAQSVVSLSQDFGDIITSGLKANVKYSFDALTSNTIIREFSPETWLATGRDADGNLLYQQTATGQAALGFEKSNGGNRITYLEASLSYDRLFAEKHRVGALFLFNQRQRNVIVPANALASLPYRTQGIAGRVTYALFDRYFAEFNIGYNGSENFSPGKRFGFFPAGAVGWLVSSEKFWEPFSKTVDVLKLRASYGIVGNDQIGGDRRFIYEETIWQHATEGRYQFNANKTMGGLRVGEVANPNVGWEEAKKTNLGLEMNFLKSSIRFQGDYFYEKRDGIFLQRKSIPTYVGVSTMPYVNIGRMKNMGFDSSLEVDRKLGDVMLTGRANFTYSHNTILNNDNPSYSELYRNRNGQRYGQYFGYQAIGFFKDEDDISNSPSQFGGTLSPGDIKYKDINGDGVIDENDEIPIGYAAIPEIVYGFGLSAQWKGLDVSTFFQGVGRTSIKMGGYSLDPFASGNLSRSAINEEVYKHRWYEGNMDNALYPRLSDVKNTNNSPDARSSTLWMRDGSFLRLKTVEIGYSLPKKMLQNTFLGSVRFYVTGVNLLTFSKFKLWDPERGSGQGAAYPPNKTISFGLNVNI